MGTSNSATAEAATNLLSNATLLEMLNKFRKYTIVIWVQPKHTLTFP
jgi:hypothetical protein